MDPKDLKFTKDHQWCFVERDLITVGITEYAAKRIKDVIFVEMPDPGDDVLTDEPIGQIETVESLTSIFSPADGVATEVNTRLTDGPAALCDDPYGEGWLVKVRAADPGSLGDLLSHEQYQSLLKSL